MLGAGTLHWGKRPSLCILTSINHWIWVVPGKRVRPWPRRLSSAEGCFWRGLQQSTIPGAGGRSECLSPEVGGVWVAYHDIHHPIFFFLLSTHIFLLAWLCLINICSLISRILGLSSSYATNLSLSLTGSLFLYWDTISSLGPCCLLLLLSILLSEHLPSMA